MSEMTQLWPADKVSRWPIARLVPYARNSNVHSPEQIAQLAASMKEWGWTMPCLVAEDGTIIAGHGRVMAATQLGFTEVPVMVATGWSEAQRRAYVIADNKLARNSTTDADMLALELRELVDLNFQVDLTGFNQDELADLLVDRTEGLTDPDDVPAAPETAVSRLGDVWVLGDHRITCGDSTDQATVTAALGGNVPVLMVTDPPYGVEYDADWRNSALRADGSKIGNRAVGKVLNDDIADWRATWALFPGRIAYVWHSMVYAHKVAESLLSVGLKVRAQIVWVKNQLVISRGHYHNQHEPLFYAVREDDMDWQPDHEIALYTVKEGQTENWRGGRKQSTVWFIDKNIKSETGHSTQKPIECMKRPIENNANPGQWVYEPFSGSGTTIIAGEMTGRRVAAIELNPPYVDINCLRWSNFTGGKAVLEATGESFDVVAARRLVEVKNGEDGQTATA
jgi:DNA modification methylase